MSEDQKQVEDEPSRRTFLKVSAVAGAAVAAVAAGAGMIPKIASSATKPSAAALAAPKPEAKATSTSAREPLILVLRGDSLDVYKGQSKIAIQDSDLAGKIASHVAAKME